MRSNAGPVLGPSARDADANAAPRQEVVATACAVAFVGVQLQGALALLALCLCGGRATGDRHPEDRRVRVLHPGQPCGQREAVPVDHRMALRARFAAIHPAGACRRALPPARTLALAKLARLARLAEPIQQHPVRALPHARHLPALELPPTGAPSPEFARQIVPAHLGLGHDDDPARVRAIQRSTIPVSRLRRAEWQQRIDERPQFIVDQCMYAHADDNTRRVPELCNRS